MNVGRRYPDPETMARVKAAHDRIAALGTAREADVGPLGVAEITCLAESANGDDELCAVAIQYIEQLLDEHGTEVIEEMESAMRTSAPLRRAYTCADHELPDDLRWRLDALVGPEDKIS